MSDPLPRTAPSQRPTYGTMNDAAAALGDFGTASATPRPPARDPGRPRPSFAQAEAQSDPEAYQDTGQSYRRSRQTETPRAEDGADPHDDPAGDRQQEDNPDDFAPEDPIELPPDAVLWTDAEGQPVTRDEAERGYLRQADYTRKTQWLAQRHQTLETSMGEVHADREAVAQLILNSLPRLDQQAVAGMTGEQVLGLQQQHNQMLGFVQQVRERTAAERQQMDEQAMQAAAAALPLVLPEWSDPQVRERQQGIANRYLQSIGAPDETRHKINRDPWLVKMALQAAVGRPVLQGGQRGRQMQQRQNGDQQAGQGYGYQAARANPSLPAAHGAPPPPTRQVRDRDAMREQARGGGSYRARFGAGVALLDGRKR